MIHRQQKRNAVLERQLLIYTPRIIFKRNSLRANTDFACIHTPAEYPIHRGDNILPSSIELSC